MTVRLAWHASGTYDASDKSGGSNGATMRFEPEQSDGANNGLSIMRDMLKRVCDNHPELSIADVWSLAGCAAIEFAGGTLGYPLRGNVLREETHTHTHVYV